MPLQRHATDFENLAPETLAAWREIPPAIVSDCMNRTHFMAAAIKPLKPGTVLAGQARTVTSMVGDNGISHAALALVNKGEVLVIDAGGYQDVAVWGSIMTHAAMARGIAGVVIDGAVRDATKRMPASGSTAPPGQLAPPPAPGSARVPRLTSGSNKDGGV